MSIVDDLAGCWMMMCLVYCLDTSYASWRQVITQFTIHEGNLAQNPEAYVLARQVSQGKVSD